MSTEQTITGQEKLDQTLDVMDGLFRDRLTEIGQILKRGEERPDAKARIRLSEALAEDLLLPAVLNPNRVTQTDKAKLAVAILDVINTIDTEVVLDDKGEPREPTPAGRLQTIISTAKDELRNLVIEINQRELPPEKTTRALQELDSLIKELRTANVEILIIRQQPDFANLPEFKTAGNRLQAATRALADFPVRVTVLTESPELVQENEKRDLKIALTAVIRSINFDLEIDQEGTEILPTELPKLIEQAALEIRDIFQNVEARGPREPEPEPAVPFVPDREKARRKFSETLRKIGEEFIEGDITEEERDERTNQLLGEGAEFLRGDFILKQGFSSDEAKLRMTASTLPLSSIKDRSVRISEFRRRVGEVLTQLERNEITRIQAEDKVAALLDQFRAGEMPPEPPLTETIPIFLKALEQARKDRDPIIIADVTRILRDRLRELKKEEDRIGERIVRLARPGPVFERQTFLAAAQSAFVRVRALIRKIQEVAPVPEQVLPEPSETEKIQNRLREHGFQLEKFTQDPNEENTKALQDSRDSLDEALKKAGLTAVDINTELLLEPPSPTVGDVMRDASTFLDRLIFPYERKFGPLFVPKAPDITLLWDRAVESAKTARQAFLKGDLNAMNSAFAGMLPRLALFRNRVQKDADVLGNAGPFLQKHSSTVLELADKHGDGLASALAGRIGELPSGPGAVGTLIERNTLAACILGAFYGALEAVREAAGRIRIEDAPGGGQKVIGIEFPELGGTPPNIDAEKTAEQATIFQESLRGVDAKLKEPVPDEIVPTEEIEEPISRPARPELEREFRLPRRPPLAPAPPRSIPPP